MRGLHDDLVGAEGDGKHREVPRMLAVFDYLRGLAFARGTAGFSSRDLLVRSLLKRNPMALLRASEAERNAPLDPFDDADPHASLIALLQVPEDHPWHREACIQAIHLVTRRHLVDGCVVPFVAPLLSGDALAPREAMAIRGLAAMYEQEDHPACALALWEALAACSSTDSIAAAHARRLRSALSNMLNAAARTSGSLDTPTDRLLMSLEESPEATGPASHRRLKPRPE